MKSFSAADARSLSVLFYALTLAAASGACSGTDESDGDDLPATSMPPLVASALSAELAAAGVDTQNPPTWEELSRLWESRAAEGPEALVAAATPVMTLFVRSLGLSGCQECHSEANYGVSARTKNITMNMWDQWVHGLRLKEGGLLFCDSCHQGTKNFLPRDDAALATWMRDNFIMPLSRVDGEAQRCTSCHGEPFEGEFLTTWAEGN